MSTIMRKNITTSTITSMVTMNIIIMRVTSVIS